MINQQEIGFCFFFLFLSLTRDVLFHPDLNHQKSKEFKLGVIALSYLKQMPLSTDNALEVDVHLLELQNFIFFPRKKSFASDPQQRACYSEDHTQL